MNIKTPIFAATLMLATAFTQAEDLQVKVYNASPESFSVNSTLISGEKEAVVIDAGFTRADALRIAANVLDSNKQLTTILVSQADPDYYFGAETLKQIFPEAKVVATPAVVEKIKAKLPAKLATWSPRMGANAPVKPLLPTPLTGNTLTLEGKTIEIRGTTGILAHRPYVWIPSIKTLTGNIGVFGNMHVWTADTATAAQRRAWRQQLDEMAALQPQTVIPGHAQAGAQYDASAIRHTRDYLNTFEQKLAASPNSTALIDNMQKAYPDLGGQINLELGAKVNKGEMKW
ncbi:MBL fold metallo-hydrolase [Uruburuella testudinis]|uniref:MBL fold metallo-hydrolase n=1 Tax=Uruburuella testudinis TaxID=1282863 RepID=A0ABY4DWS1_9NEIS|nr:MBL fold metallo-hydrolase [Uruburuella testudinis]UOO82933.1 MBL fold metallo-hydrolase [Uruburuella testudinis]